MTWNHHKIRTAQRKTPLQLLFECPNRVVEATDNIVIQNVFANLQDCYGQKAVKLAACPLNNDGEKATFSAAIPPLTLLDHEETFLARMYEGMDAVSEIINNR